MKIQVIRPLARLILGLCTFLPAASASSTTYYVSTTGSNTNDGLTTTSAWRNIQYAANHGAKVANASWGAPGTDTTVANAISYAAIIGALTLIDIRRTERPTGAGFIKDIVAGLQYLATHKLIRELMLLSLVTSIKVAQKSP